METTMVTPVTGPEETCLPGMGDIPAQTQRLMLQVSGIMLTCILATLSLWTTFSNLTIIIAIFRFNSSHSPHTWVLCSQAFSDFMIGTSVMPLALHMAVEVLVTLKTNCHFDKSPGVFEAYLYFHWVSTLGTVSNFAISSIDRYFAVSRPLRYRTTVNVKHAKRFLAAFWIVLFVLEIKFYRLAASQIAVLLAGILNTVVFQILVLKTFRKHNATRAVNLRSDSLFEVAMKQEKTMAKRIGLLIATLCCCTLPMIVFVIFQVAFTKTVESCHAFVGPLVTLAFYSNSALNPFLYCWKNENVKTAVKKVLRMN